ncbi:LacI family DNA-binding transcriptional regulator [Phytohabitans suffuscus]|uniref:LacI family transcriptional regulator n=1 Tax=Phytohabitans suffuscus TaxID=624315 RepID=A0A6F8YUQ8_9ACTN|nr:LacI family DNA-binding transcriptional regulator [Phytohabitans suffuscus]BCB89890.1 LacI family transcriptional regulator [Phytohabitans suffuscus]
MNGSRPTIEDVARVAGVSRATASRVLNDAPGASEVLRRRVTQAIADLGYRPNETARALASGRQRTVDLIAVIDNPDLALGAHPYYSRVLAGVVAALETVNVQLRVQVVAEHDTARRIDTIAADLTAGAILANAAPDLATQLHQRSRKVVSIVPTAPSVPAVEADNAGGAHAAVRHLHALGRRRIAAIHGPDLNTCAIARRAGHRRAVKAFKLPDISTAGGFTREGGHAAALRLLDEHPDIDAMFVACDLMAAGAIQAITATGRRVPHDVSVIGFDDNVVAICTNPLLTTMRLPTEEMATAATRMLLTGTITPGHRERFTVELVERDSASPVG